MTLGKKKIKKKSDDRYILDTHTHRHKPISFSRPHRICKVVCILLQRRDVDWEKVPFVPRPSLIADPITAFGKRKPRSEEQVSILTQINRAGIKPKAEILERPIHPYISARDSTRNRVLTEVRRNADIRDGGGSAALVTDKFSMDKILPRVHNTAAAKNPHRHVFFCEPSKFLKPKKP